jgi:hypothetical protein
VADAVAELGGAFVAFVGDGVVELALEFLEFGEGFIFFDFGGEFVEGVERAVAFVLVGFVLDVGERLDGVRGSLDDGEGVGVVVVVELDHGGGDSADAEDVGAPLFEVIFVFIAGGVAMDEVEEAEVAGGIADGAGPVFDLEEVEIAIVVEDAFVEEFNAIVGVEAEGGVLACSPGLVELGDVMVEEGLGVMGAEAVGAAIEFVLFDAEREADVHDVAAVGEGDEADTVFGVVGPRFEKRFEIRVAWHGRYLGNIASESATWQLRKGDLRSIRFGQLLAICSA